VKIGILLQAEMGIAANKNHLVCGKLKTCYVIGGCDKNYTFNKLCIIQFLYSAAQYYFLVPGALSHRNPVTYCKKS